MITDTVFFVLRIFNLIVAISALAYSMYIWRREDMPGMLAPITWLINLILFYLVRLVDAKIDPVILNAWSSAIHLHACILILGALIILGQRKPKTWIPPS